MNTLWYGLIGFGAIILYDLNNVNQNNDRLESLYSVGAGLIGLAIFMQLFMNEEAVGSSLPLWIRILTGTLAGIAFVLLAYSSLYAGKRNRWGHRSGEKSSRWWERELADTGLYALCRHPSVWLLMLMCFLLVPAAGFPYVGATIYSVAGLLLAYYEDRNVFPEVVKGYSQYRKTTPFLLPTRESFRRCAETWKKK